MQTYTWFIAKRFFAHSGQTRRVSRPAIQIATAGVALGVAIMLLSVFVVLGFKREIQGKITGFSGHIQIVNYETLRSAEAQPIVVDDSLISTLESIPGVGHVQRFCTKTGMLKTDEAFSGVSFRGVGPEYDTLFLHRHLTQGCIPHFSDTASTGQMLLSETLARRLSLGLGDRVFAYFFEKNVRARRFTVAGIYRTNLTDFDNNLAFVDLAAVHSLLSWDSQQYAGAEVVLKDFGQLEQVSSRIVQRINRSQDAYGAYYTSPTIRELYPVIFNWLDLLNMDVLVILVLMVCVAGFTMVSGLLIIILERTNFIGVMKALGASNRPLRHIFLYFAAFIILRGLVVGNALAFLLAVLQKRFSLIHLDPETYYMDTVPLHIDWSYVLIINVSMLLLCMLALLLPSYIVSRIEPARSIRFE